MGQANTSPPSAWSTPGSTGRSIPGSGSPTSEGTRVTTSPRSDVAGASPEPPLVLELELAAPLERVWRAWTEPGELEAWLAEQARVSLEPGAPFELFWEPAHPERNSTLGCRLTEVEEGRTLAFEWRGPVPFADLMNVDPLPTSVTVCMEKLVSGGTRLHLEHVGWGAGPR